MNGIHVEGGRDGGGGNDGQVELRFTTADSPDLVERWYRDPARAADFTIQSAAARAMPSSSPAPARRIRAASGSSLPARQGGGTDGRAVLSDN